MISPEAEKQLLSSTVRDVTTDYIGKRLALWSNLNLLDNIPKVNGSSTLQLRVQAQVQALLYAGTNQSASGLIDFLAVTCETKPGTAVEWVPRNGLALVTAGQRPLYETPARTLEALADPRFNPRDFVYLPPEAEGRIRVAGKTPVRLVLQDFSARRVRLETEADVPSLVVFAQSYYHPWKAHIDGLPTRLWRANHAFQAVEVPAGRHSVTLIYRDDTFLIGAAITGLTVIGCAAWWRRLRRPGLSYS
jgi:hypothetical protein